MRFCMSRRSDSSWSSFLSESFASRRLVSENDTDRKCSCLSLAALARINISLLYHSTHTIPHTHRRSFVMSAFPHLATKSSKTCRTKSTTNRFAALSVSISSSGLHLDGTCLRCFFSASSKQPMSSSLTPNRTRAVTPHEQTVPLGPDFCLCPAQCTSSSSHKDRANLQYLP